ncbi:DUF2637 domain-containing protein [Streptomyces sp. NPDC101225]|uniref:DUF2637 domain-containing protein n=1 Tax=Streptomyces sp. NPDC101225 TaxID=3366135 RepID=UPI0037FD361B
MTTATETARPAVPPLTKPETGLAGLGALTAAGVGALGLIASFDAVSSAATRWGFGAPWMLPVGIDMAIPVFTVANLLLIRMDMALAWVRFVPWALTLVTCGLNVAAGHSLWAQVAHGTMPLLWVVFAEIGAHVYAVRIGAATGRRMEKVRFSRWVLAPVSTFALWRRMTLWEITSYPEALKRERERQLARARLRERHGRRWRSQTPLPERVLLKLGELAPASEDVPLAPPQPPTEPKPEAPKTPRKRPASAKNKAKTAKAPRTTAELLTEAREATADWADDAINAEAIRTTLHCSAANSRLLRDQLLSDRAEGRRLHSVDADDETEGAAA